MTEHDQESRDVVGVLRDRLGVRYQASIDDGRAEIVRVLADELKIGRDEADSMTSQLIDSGRIRYVTGVERDVEYDTEAHQDERGDADNRRGAAGVVAPDLTDRTDILQANAIPGGGGPQTTASGLHAGAAAPVAAGSSGAAPGALPLAAGVDIGAGAEEQQRRGFWDFGAGAAGVVPSTTRKGQVEPRGA